MGVIFRRRLLSLLLVVAALLQPRAVASQTSADGVGRLLARLERALESNDPETYLDLLSPAGNREHAEQMLDNLRSRPITLANLRARPITRAVLRERDRSHLEGTLPGNGFQVLAEAFIEYGRLARVLTIRFDVKRSSSEDEEWRVSDQEILTSLDGLYRLALTADKQFAAKNLSVLAEDFQLLLPAGSVFVSETPDGVTGVVLVGRGELIFKPTPATERGQVKLITGAEVLQTRFDAAFLRMNPDDFADYVSRSALTERSLDPREFKRAEEIFKDEVPKSFGLELNDLSRESWSLLPPLGDFLAEVRTRKYDTLTYAHSGSEAEDITLFDRRRHRNIAVYASRRTLASRGRFYSEDDRADYDVLDYRVETTFSPDRDWIDGQTTMKLKIKAPALNTMSVRLADPLNVQSVVSREFGRLLTIRVRNQNTIVVNFPAAVLRDTPVTLTVKYSGRLPGQVPEREAIATNEDQQRRDVEDTPIVPPEPNFLYSNRSYWYAQSTVTDYATATLQLTVPATYSCVASGELTAPPVVGPKTRGDALKTYTFVARQPVRYLAAVISRFVRVDTTTVSLRPTAADNSGKQPGDGAIEPGGGLRIREAQSVDAPFESLQMAIEANPRQQGRARDLSQRAAQILKFYTSLVGDCPYPSFTLALVENSLPGGHSPAYFAALNQPLPTSPFTWRNDPASFTNFPDFFLAHELAHQWWGQAVGWKNFHEQWLSEGFAQYFSALYAKQQRGDEVFDGIVRQLRRWSLEQSDQGPVHLGYRLGHVKGDTRIFRALVYNKGAAVLHMLRRFVGDDAFFRGLRRFYSTWKFKKASTEDVRAAFETESGRSLARFFELWIYGSAIPRLRVTTRIDEGEAVIRVEQLGEVFDIPVTITIVGEDGRPSDVVVAVSERLTERRIPATGGIREILVNRDDAAVAEFVK